MQMGDGGCGQWLRVSGRPLFHVPKASRGVRTTLLGGFGGVIFLRAQEKGERGVRSIFSSKLFRFVGVL